MKTSLFLVCTSLSIAACGGGSKGFGDEGAPTPPGGSDPQPGAIGGGSPGAGGTGDLGKEGEKKQPAEVYGHSPDTLYKLDPETKAVTVIGPFQGCSQVIDIAIDENSNLFGTTQSGLWSIDRNTARCTYIAGGSYPNSLSFVPKGTLDPSVEALVGYDGSEYIRIDTTTGSITRIGSIGSGLTSSGDIVSVKGGSTYLTVKGTGCNDCLVEVDPKTGRMLKNLGRVSHNDVFGLAFWGGRLFGFDDAGELFEVTLQNNSVKTTPIAIPNRPSSLQFWGAGSTTSAPLAPR
jgi:hypothetical protein